MSFFFNGRLWTSPATMSQVDDSAMFNRNLSVGNVLAVIGRAEGGEPFTALRFGGADEAKAVLRSGESLKAIQLAFDPSAQVAAPAEIVFVRVNPATQSALALLDGASAPVINLVSEGFGKFTKGIKVKIEAGSLRGKKLTSQFGNDYYSADNVARDVLSVTYVGVGASAVVSVTAASVVLTVGGAVVETIDLADYPTVQELVDRINGVPDFESDVVDGNGAKDTLNALDFATSLDVKAAPVTLSANLQAVVDWFNSVGEGFITATRPAGAGTLPANIGFTYLSGGSDGEVTLEEWQRAFDVLQNVDAQWVVAISPMPAIHAMTDSHCAFMSNVALKERRCINGTDVGTTDEAAKAAAKALNSDRSSLVHLGFYDYDGNGKLALFPPYILAAMIAGAFSGVNPGTALTNKTLKLRGLERKLRNPTDTDQLIKGGVLCVEDTDKGYKVVQSITTWLVNDNYNRVEISVGVAVDFVSRELRAAVDDLRGAKGNVISMADALSRADSKLRELSRPEPMGVGVLVGDAQNPPYKGLTVSLDGDTMRIEVQGSPVIPLNYIAIVIHAVPYSGSVSA